MGYQCRTRVSSGHRAWEREHSKRLICSGGPLGFWYAPGFFVPPPAHHHQLPVTGFVEEIPPDRVQYKVLDYKPLYMATNGFNSWDQTSLKTEHDPHTPESDWSPAATRNNNDMMDAGHHFLEPASSPFHASTFNDPYHVSPIPSPETTANRLMLPARTQQQAQDPMSFHWSGAAAPFSDYQTGFSTSPDWQTLPPFEPHGLPYDYTHPAMMPYVSAWKETGSIPMDSVEYSTQPHPAGSFSSTDSSSFGNSFTNSFSVQDTWQTHDMAHQYSLRPRLQLPASSYADERDTSLEGTISPKLTRIIPSPSFQSAPSSPTHLFPRRDSDSSSSSDGTVEDQPVTNKSLTSKDHAPRADKPPHRHQRTRLPSPKASSRGSISRRLLALAPSSTAKSSKATTTSSTSSSKHLKPTKECKPSRDQQAGPCAPPPLPSRPDSRAAKDEFLLKSKAKGMTYKEIRRKGNFAEAESTLRGRYRTLTKPKDLRVRKPEWSENDLRLLEQGVRQSVLRGQNLTTAKIPWREVADYIYQNGGSYLFGLSTCRKRWDELVLAETGRGKDVARAFYEQ